LAAQRKTEKVAGLEVPRRTLPPRLRLREILLKVLCTSMLNPASVFPKFACKNPRDTYKGE